MVLGFAMCSTFAFAQTGSLNVIAEKAQCQRSQNPTEMVQQKSYKASIFTKDSVFSRWEFASNEMSVIAYGAQGYVTAGMVIGDATSTPHGQTADAFCWQRVNDSADLYGNQIWQNVSYKSYVNYYMSSNYTGNENGYMLMALSDEFGSGVHNAFIGFPAVERPASAGIIDVRFNQMYINYYDECYIDYKIGNSWKTRAINVDGVDVAINSIAPVFASYTMPIELASQDSIAIRIRYYADGSRGTVYGYLWAVDNVELVSGEANRWVSNSQMFLDGFYGTLPQGMEIPLTWYGEAINTGATTHTNVSLNFSHLDNNLQSDNILNAEQDNIAPDPLTLNYMVVDERGFFAGEQAGRPASQVFEAGDIGGSYLGWWYYAPTYGVHTTSQQYGMHGLPVSTLGQQFFAASATSDNVDDIAWDTMSYQVVGETGGDGNLSLAGYRWGWDNGIIPSGSCYQFGFVYYGSSRYVTDNSENWSSAGYTVMGRFTTGNTIPTDWVFRGVELIPQTESALADIVGSTIYPYMWEGVWNSDSNDWDLVDVNTGSYNSESPYTVVMSDLNNLATGRLAPSDEYNAVNFRFPSQPVLKPNTSYYIGYRLASDGKFGVAKQQWTYLAENGTTNVRYYNDANPEVANGYYQFTPGAYDIYVYDPTTGGYYAGYNSDQAPMIRPVVGPRVELSSYNITANCGTGVEITDDVFENICNSPVVGYEGGFVTVYIFPEGEFCDTCNGAYKIDINTLMVDNNVVDLDGTNNGFTVTEGAYNVYNADSSVLELRRYYYAITFSSLDANHAVSANAVYTEWEPVTGSIDPAAMHVTLGLQPNPATSSVKLNINGVSGMVNCSIIDMSGRVVYNANVNAEQQQVIDLSNVAAGAYFVRVTNDSFSKVEKLIVR